MRLAMVRGSGTKVWWTRSAVMIGFAVMYPAILSQHDAAHAAGAFAASQPPLPARDLLHLVQARSGEIGAASGRFARVPGVVFPDTEQDPIAEKGTRGIIRKDAKTGLAVGPIAPQPHDAKARMIISKGVRTDLREGIIPSAHFMLPYSALGIIHVDFGNGVVEQGTGFLVDPGIVLTAGHVLHSPHHGPAKRVSFTPACGMAKGLTQTIDARRYRVSAAWAAGDAKIGGDYGAIFLPDRRLYATCGIFKLASVAPTFIERHLNHPASEFMVAGYPADKASGTLWSATGMLRSRFTGSVAHLIDTMPGESGAPLFTSTVDKVSKRKQPLVIAIHSRPMPRGENANQARLIDETMVRDLKQWTLEIMGRID